MAFSLIDPKQLKRIRIQLGVTQSKIALEAGVSQSLIAKIEAGGVDPTFSSLKAISQALRSHNAMEGTNAASVMSAPVIGVQTIAKLSDCIVVMKKYEISQIPVLDGKRFVGSVTESHVLGVVSEFSDPAAALTQPVKKVMQPSFPIIDKDTPVEALISLFIYAPAVLVSSGDEIKGIITKIDLLAAEAKIP